MKTKHVIIGVTLAIAFTCFVSCKKDKKDEEKDTDTAGAYDQSLASSTSNDMVSISDEAGRTKNVSSFKVGGTSGLLSTCAQITFDTINGSNIDTINVNFGTTNCLCNDGRYRRGSLVISYTGKYKDSATVITITPQNYYVNDNQVTGSKTITNKGHNSQNHLVYEIVANINIIKAGGAGTIVWQSTRNREWLTGENTLAWADDIYSITGSASGTSAAGNSFTSVITSPLIRNMSIGCRKHFTQGVIEHTPSGKATRTIDYGSGACDNVATVTINNQTFTITLP